MDVCGRFLGVWSVVLSRCFTQCSVLKQVVGVSFSHVDSGVPFSRRQLTQNRPDKELHCLHASLKSHPEG